MLPFKQYPDYYPYNFTTSKTIKNVFHRSTEQTKEMNFRLKPKFCPNLVVPGIQWSPQINADYKYTLFQMKIAIHIKKYVHEF